MFTILHLSVVDFVHCSHSPYDSSNRDTVSVPNWPMYLSVCLHVTLGYALSACTRATYSSHTRAGLWLHILPIDDGLATYAFAATFKQSPYVVLNGSRSVYPFLQSLRITNVWIVHKKSVISSPPYSAISTRHSSARLPIHYSNMVNRVFACARMSA